MEVVKKEGGVFFCDSEPNFIIYTSDLDSEDSDSEQVGAGGQVPTPKETKSSTMSELTGSN